VIKNVGDINISPGLLHSYAVFDRCYTYCRFPYNITDFINAIFEPQKKLRNKLMTLQAKSIRENH